MNAYIKSIFHYYKTVAFDDLPTPLVHQAQRCLLDSLGCMVAAQPHCQRELAFVQSLHGGVGTCDVFGTGIKLSPADAVFANTILASALEMDDATGVGASVHLGSCVIPAALVAAQQTQCDGQTLLKAILLGYDLCNRLGLLATEEIRRLGLYGPGVLAAPCSGAVMGFIQGQTEEMLMQSLSIALSMSPICPFSAFTDGADSKNFYVGWGAYLGALSCQMADQGFTGARHMFQGKRSMAFLFASTKGADVAIEDGTYSGAVMFKPYGGCLSVHATITALEQLRQSHEFGVEDIASIQIGTYPYAVDLNDLVEILTPVSARVSLPYTVASYLLDGHLDPSVFTPEALGQSKRQALMERVSVYCVDAYGADSFGVRGSQVRITLQDGTVLEHQVTSGKWGMDAPPSDQMLVDKFHRIVASAMTTAQKTAMVDTVFAMQNANDLTKLFGLLAQIHP